MTRKLRSSALAWADAVVEGTFFLLQNYLTDVWKLSFTNAAAFLNIWGGINRILPIAIVFLARNNTANLVNFIMLTLSGILSTTGLVLISYTTLPGYRCHQKGESQCVGSKEKALFITGMALVGLGRATRSAFSQPNITDNESVEEDETINSLDGPSCVLKYLRWIFVILFFVTPAVAFFAFPYVKKWYILFGVSAICTALATLSHLSGFRSYNHPAVATPASVIKQAIKKLFFPGLDRRLETATPHASDEEQPSYMIRNTVIRKVVLYSGWILCGVVSSIGNTYFVQQATTMDYNIGQWKPPLQVLQLTFLAFRLYSAIGLCPEIFEMPNKPVEVSTGSAMLYSVVCCAVAAAVERRRVHAVRRLGLAAQPDDVRTPVSAFWLLFPVCFLGIVQGAGKEGIYVYHKKEVPESMKRYRDCLDEAVTGLGYVCSVLSVYVVGKISETGGGKGWFQHTLNSSRLDRYYWVLAALSGVWLSAVIFLPGLCDCLFVCYYALYLKFRKGVDKKSSNGGDEESEAQSKAAD